MSPCLFNLYAEYIKRNTGLDEAQTGIKIAGINVSNLNTIIMAESEEELKSLLMKVKEEESEKFGLKFNIQKLRSWHLVPSLHGKYGHEEERAALGDSSQPKRCEQAKEER